MDGAGGRDVCGGVKGGAEFVGGEIPREHPARAGSEPVARHHALGYAAQDKDGGGGIGSAERQQFGRRGLVEAHHGDLGMEPAHGVKKRANIV